MNPPRSFWELLHRYDLGERDFTDAELDEDRENNASGMCLDGADFSRSLIVADFQRASLRGACFNRANVKACDFREADLRDADFRDALICSAQFDNAKLEGAMFTGASAYGYVFKDGETPND